MAEIVKELLEKRDLYSKHFLNNDGSITAKIGLSPIHYKTEKEQLEDIDLTIIPEINWEFEYSLKKNSFRAYFNDVTDIENYTLAGFELINKNGASRWINFKMYGANPIADSYDRNCFKYYSVFPNVDLEYIVTPQRLKENIIVNDVSALKPFEFTLKIDDYLRMEVQEDNSINFIDIDTGEKLWEIAKPYAIDSSEKSLRTDNILYTFGKKMYGGIEYDSITIELQDEEFLSNAIYPIMIDPTVSINDSRDTYIYSTQGSTSYGTDNPVRMGNDGSQGYSALLYFNLTGIPIKSVISEAKVNLYLVTNFGYDGNTYLNIKAYKITSAWNENVIWSNAPAYSYPTYYGTTRFDNSISINQWCAVSVLSLIQSAILDLPSYYGIEFIADSYNGYGRLIDFKSDEDTSYKPYLTVTYNEPPTTPNVTSPTNIDSLDSQHTITWDSSTDAECDNISYEVDLSIDNGQTYKNIGSGIAVNYLSYDFSNEVETQQAIIRVRAYDGVGYSDYGYSGTFIISHGKTYVKTSGAYVKCKVYKKVGGVYQEVKLYKKVIGEYIKI